MDITWLGHSCFKIKGKQATVITDPFSPSLGYPMSKTTADIVTVSHSHPGHSYTEGISGTHKIINGPGEYEVGGVLFIGLETFHDSEKGKKSGKNTVYLMEVDEISICHLGDLGHTLNAEQLEEMGKVDILLAPVGGLSTINASGAAEAVRQFEPRIVIPMHYKTPAIKWELDPVDRFLKEMGANEVAPQPKLTVTRANLLEGTKVVVLAYQ